MAVQLPVGRPSCATEFTLKPLSRLVPLLGRTQIIVRKLVHSFGYRYRLHRKDLPGKPDLVFSKLKKIIFVHGYFWHQHISSLCKIARIPKSRIDYWIPKLQRNVERDNQHYKFLESTGWDILIVWECEVKRTNV